ncbi:MAG: class I SAM-dependent methyltransferase [Eubacteriales bacterium]
MESYGEFARVYDTFMEETPYETWCNSLITFLHEYQIKEGLVLDLGCGSGTMTELMAQEGYDMIGIDCSREMLQVAMDKKEESRADILYLNQDMRSFELYGTVRAVYSVCDSINYIVDLQELREVFRLVNNYLETDGMFICDFNTIYKYEEVIGNTTIAENREDCSFIWDNYYDHKTHLNEYDLTLFIREGQLFQRVMETHYQRGYTIEEVTLQMELAGLEVCKILDADTLGVPVEETQRVYVIAREQGKSEK